MKLIVALAFLAVASGRPDAQPIELPQSVLPQFEEPIIVQLIQPSVQVVDIAEDNVFDAQPAETYGPYIDAVPADVPQLISPLARTEMDSIVLPNGAAAALLALEKVIREAVNIADTKVNNDEADQLLSLLAPSELETLFVPEDVMVAYTSSLKDAHESVNVVDAPVDDIQALDLTQVNPQDSNPSIDAIFASLLAPSELESLFVPEEVVAATQDAHEYVNVIDAPVDDIQAIDLTQVNPQASNPSDDAIFASLLAPSELESLFVPEEVVAASQDAHESVNVVDAPVDDIQALDLMEVRRMAPETVQIVDSNIVAETQD